MNDRKIIKAGVKEMVRFGNDELEPHFIYCGDYYMRKERISNFEKMFFKQMKKFGIQSSMLTMLFMRRDDLVTKEKAKEASEGKLKNDEDWEEVSIIDDFEMLRNNIINSKRIKKELVESFFTIKLTKEELKLVESKNKDHLETYYCHYRGYNPDVDPEEMKKSDSKSKYVQCYCNRLTYYLKLEENKKKKFTLKNFCNNISII